MIFALLYDFARTDLKTEDNYFRGFPALWNVVAFYLLRQLAAAAGWPGDRRLRVGERCTFAPSRISPAVPRSGPMPPWLPWLAHRLGPSPPGPWLMRPDGARPRGPLAASSWPACSSAVIAILDCLRYGFTCGQSIYLRHAAHEKGRPPKRPPFPSLVRTRLQPSAVSVSGRRRPRRLGLVEWRVSRRSAMRADLPVRPRR